MPPGSLGCLAVAEVVIIALTLGLTVRFVGSWNPLDVLHRGTVGQVVGISICGLFGGSIALQLLAAWALEVGSRRMDPRAKSVLSCVLFGAVVLALSFAFSGFVNPIEGARVVKGGRLVVLVCVSAIWVGSFFRTMFWLAVVKHIEGTTSQSFWDVRCRFCQKPVCELTIQTGFPMRCGHCREWVHMLHWTANGGSPQQRCPGCVRPTDAPGLDDLLRQWRDRM